MTLTIRGHFPAIFLQKSKLIHTIILIFVEPASKIALGGGGVGQARLVDKGGRGMHNPLHVCGYLPSPINTKMTIQSPDPLFIARLRYHKAAFLHNENRQNHFLECGIANSGGPLKEKLEILA